MIMAVFTKRSNWGGKSTLNVSGTISCHWAQDWITKRKQAEREHSSLSASCLLTQCTQLPHTPALMSSLPQWTVFPWTVSPNKHPAVRTLFSRTWACPHSSLSTQIIYQSSPSFAINWLVKGTWISPRGKLVDVKNHILHTPFRVHVLLPHNYPRGIYFSWDALWYSSVYWS